MAETLFEIPVSESPRLKWLREHGVKVGKNIFEPTHSDDFRFGYKFAAHCGDVSEYGHDEDEALIKLAILNGWKLWNEI